MSIFQTDGAFGSAVAAEEWAAFVLEGLSNESVLMASGATVVPTSASKVHIPRIDVGAAGWFGELDPINVGDPGGAELVLEPRKVAAYSLIGNETVHDANVSVLDNSGAAMVKSVALAADTAMVAGGGALAPDGILNTTPALQNVTGEPTYENIVTAGGEIAAAGGVPDVVFLHPADYVALQLATDGMNRPLIQPDAQQGGAVSIAGYRVRVTPAVGEGTALVAEARQIVVAVNSQPSVEISADAEFEKDGTAVRVIARLDAGVSDARGLCTITT